MSINVIYEDECVYSMEINDAKYYADGEDTVTIPISVLSKEEISDLPLNVAIEICDSCDDNLVMVHNIPTTITRTDESQLYISFDETMTRKYWDAPIGLKLWMETKRDIISERESALKDVILENYEDDGAYIHLSYSASIYASSFEDLFCVIDTIYNEIEGATDIALGSPFEKMENCKNENDFTVKILLPLFRNLGFANVKYNHGNQEYGKDIVFARKTEFDDYEHYGVQVKFGDVSGGATGIVNGLIEQIKDAFNMPFDDLYTRKCVRVSKVIVAISGKFTNNAVEKIIHGIADGAMKNNIIFLDGDKISTLLERYRRF